jgi:hypothetical protein
MLDNRFQTLSDEDMVSITHDANNFNRLGNFQVQEFYTAIRPNLRLENEEILAYHWLGSGVECRLLQADKSTAGWVNGRAKLCLAFQPEQVNTETQRPGLYIPQRDDVLEVANESARLINRQSVVVSEMITFVRQLLSISDPSQSRYFWFDRGVEGEVLKASGELSGWQSGFLRFQFEFMPLSKQPVAENSTVSQPGLDSLRQLAVN